MSDFEWCTDCKEYDHERHCCPRWTKVIRNTLNDSINAVLDEIRAEIEELDGKYVIGDYAVYGGNSPKYIQLRDVLQIIDNYKSESGAV